MPIPICMPRLVATHVFMCVTVCVGHGVGFDCQGQGSLDSRISCWHRVHRGDLQPAGFPARRCCDDTGAGWKARDVLVGRHALHNDVSLAVMVGGHCISCVMEEAARVPGPWLWMDTRKTKV